VEAVGRAPVLVELDRSLDERSLGEKSFGEIADRKSALGLDYTTVTAWETVMGLACSVHLCSH